MSDISNAIKYEIGYSKNIIPECNLIINYIKHTATFYFKLTIWSNTLSN